MTFEYGISQEARDAATETAFRHLQDKKPRKIELDGYCQPVCLAAGDGRATDADLADFKNAEDLVDVIHHSFPNIEGRGIVKGDIMTVFKQLASRVQSEGLYTFRERPIDGEHIQTLTLNGGPK